MDTLDGSDWDIVLCGTGFSQSLLALALSRSSKKILHLDKNDYYGGSEAALSLDEAETWCQKVTDGNLPPFEHAAIDRPESDGIGDTKLSFSRAYSLSLSPQLIYNRSNLLPTLVSSNVYKQLEFLAVGCWWIYEGSEVPTENAPPGRPDSASNISLRKIPSSREDVVNDNSIDLRSKRSVMRFLQLAADPEQCDATVQDCGSILFKDFLSSRFKISDILQAPFHALTLSPNHPSETTVAFALPAIHRHLTSIGLFGPGFGSVVPKWGGLAEIAQIGCRACAVGGGVYVLDKTVENDTAVAKTDAGENPKAELALRLSGGESITAHHLLDGSKYDEVSEKDENVQYSIMARSIGIISSQLDHLFPPSIDGGAPAAVAVVVFPSGSLGIAEDPPSLDTPPVHLMVHSSDTGECPAGQSVVYGQTIASGTSTSLLKAAVSRLLTSPNHSPAPQILWSMHYNQSTRSVLPKDGSKATIPQSLPASFVLEDDVLRNIRKTWESLVGDDIRDGFMTFKQYESDEEAL